jgi:hypothetical protein
MNPGLAHLLTRLYPHAWKDRYAAEFEALLLEGRSDIRLTANVLCSAVCEHLFPLGGLKMNRLSTSLGAILCAYLAIVAAGINLYATFDDSSLAIAMKTYLGLFTAWNLVALGSVAALLGALQFAIREGRRDILIRLSVAPLAAAILFAWVIGAFLGLGGRWAPAPWAIVGDWTATADWPSV